MNNYSGAPDSPEAWWDGSAICVVAVSSVGDPLDLAEHEVEAFIAKLQACLVEARAGLGQAFLSGDAIHGVQFKHNEYVRIIGGAHSGESGSLVTVLSLHPEPKFIVESQQHGDIEVFQSEIARAEV